jgi:hypothetical protein
MSYRCQVVGCVRKTDRKHRMCNMCREDPDDRRRRSREASARYRLRTSNGTRRQNPLGPRAPCACGKPPYSCGMCRPCYTKARPATWAGQKTANAAYSKAHREEARAATQAWRETNRDRDRANARRRRAEKPAEVKAANKRWRDTSPVYRASCARRRALKRGAYGIVTHQEWEELCGLYEGTCPRCKRACSKFTQDHIVPISAGGLHYIWNLQPLCLSCNCSKREKPEGYYPPPCYAR